MHEPLNNKYYKWYLLICSKGKKRGWSKKTAPCYVEKHHIVPKSLGGSNFMHNLVYLTAKEHYVCHKLLVYCYDGTAKYKMFSAYRYMFTASEDNYGRFIRSRDHELVKDHYNLLMKTEFNPMYGQTHSMEWRENHSNRMKGDNNPNYGKGLCGSKNGRYGKPISEETRTKIRKGMQKHPKYSHLLV